MSRPMTLLLAAILTISCSGIPEPLTEHSAAVTTSACVGARPLRTADVHFSGGACVRYTLPFDSAWWEYDPAYIDAVATGLGTVTSVDTGSRTGVWVCDNESPPGFASAPYAPCWVSNTDFTPVRIRGAVTNGIAAPASGVVSSIVGRSFVITQGFLADPPACPYTYGATAPPTHFHACGTQSDILGQMNWRANNDPTDSTNCCNVSAAWPDGSSGAPCMGYGGDNDHAVENYACP